MSVHKDEVKVKEIEEGTPGGKTFHILFKGDKNTRALCFRPIHNTGGEMRCEKPAGANTWHLGTGACSLHGGSGGHPVSSGRNAVVSRQRLAGSIQKYLEMERPKLLDLTQELAFTKAVFDEFSENYPDPTAEDYGIYFNRLVTLIGTLGSLVEKISRTDARNTLTAAQVLYLRVAITDILMKYIPEPDKRDRALKELANRMGGDINIEMNPSEINAPRLGL